MKSFDWRHKGVRQRVFTILTIVAIIMLASHPELRLLVPLVDALGLDLLLVLVGSQLLDFVRPALHALRLRVILPVAESLYSMLLFFLGIAGPYVGAHVDRYRLARRSPP